MTESTFDGLSISLEDKESLTSNILPFPEKAEGPPEIDEKMKRGVGAINTLFGEGKLQGLFAVTIDDNQNINIVVSGGTKDLKSYLVIASVLDSMRNDIINKASPALFPRESNGE